MSNAAVIAALEEVVMMLKRQDANPVVVVPDPPVPTGYILMPVTKHVLRLPIPDEIAFWGYMINNAISAGGTPGSYGPNAAARAFASYREKFGGSDQELSAKRDAWPLVLDRFYNWDVYATPEEKAARDKAIKDAKSSGDDFSPGRPKPDQPFPPGALYRDRAALLAANPGKAIVLDDEGIQNGFGDPVTGNPLRFKTLNGFIYAA